MRTWHDVLAHLAPLAARRGPLTALAILIAALVAFQVFFTPLTGDATIDSYSYYFAAKALVLGADPYDTATLQDLAPDELGFIFPYLYPPVLAALWRPMTGLSPEAAHTCFVWVGLALAALNAALVWRLAYPAAAGADAGAATRRAGWLALFVLAHGVMGPLVSSVRLGQVNVLLMTLVLLALLAERRDRPLLGGFFLGAAILVKLMPLVFLLDLLLRRRWRTLAATFASGAAIVLVTLPLSGSDAWRGFLSRSTETLPFNPPMSLKGLLDAIGGVAGFPREVLLGAFLVLVTILVVRLAGKLPRAAREDDPVASWGALVLFALLAAPLTWHHHYYLALLPAATGVWRAFEPAPRRSRWLLAAAAVAMLLRYPGELHVLKPIAAFLTLML